MRLIGLSLSCNNACIFCAQGGLRSSEDETADALAARVQAEVQRVEPGEIVAFAGGEPTLDDRLPSWIEAAHERGAGSILVQTNGRRLAYRAYARALREASPRLALDVSLHGSTEPMHDYHTSTPGSFKQTAQGIRNARAEGVASAVTVVVTRSNFRHLADVAAIAKSAGASAIRFAPAEAYGSAARAADRVIPAWELVKPHLAQAVVEARRLGLGVAIGDDASAPGVRERFVGIGRVEEVSAVDRRVRLSVLGRPVPGRQEVRAQVRQTGDDLKTIFPSLFGVTARAG